MSLSYNVPITFGLDGVARELNCRGIDFSEAGEESWTIEPVAELEVQLPLARQDVYVQVEVRPFLTNTILAQRIFVFVGGLFTGYFTVSGSSKKIIPVARGVLSGRAVRFSMVIPTAASPKMLGLSEDMRELGIRLSSVTFLTSAP
jgi:hypothetical protein